MSGTVMRIIGLVFKRFILMLLAGRSDQEAKQASANQPQDA